MMSLSELWKHFRFLQDLECFTEEERAFLERLLSEEYKAREKKRIAYLLKMSGIRRIKLLCDFDWTFNPKIPRDKIMEFLNTDFLKKPSNLVLIGTAGVGKAILPPRFAMRPSSEAIRPYLSLSLTSRPDWPKPGMSTPSSTSIRKSLCCAWMR